jgi:hypothetical protein
MPKLRVTSIGVLCVLITLSAAASAVHAQAVTACAMAEAETTDRLRLLFSHPEPRAPWVLGNALSSAKLARALCSGAKPERGLLLYGRINERLDNEMLAIQRAQAPAILR